MKTYLNLLTALSILLCCSCAVTKNNKSTYSDVVKPQIDLLSGEHNCTIKVFQGVFVENKIYISWTASSDYDGICYIIDKSYDNKTFKPAMIKIGTTSPKEFDLLYCATDADVELAKTKQIFYRIRVIKQYEFSNDVMANDKTINYPVIAISAQAKSGEFNLLQQNKANSKTLNEAPIQDLTSVK